MAMKRLAVFVHFDIDNIVDEYVYYYIKELKVVADEIIFVTTSKIGLEDQKKVKKIANKLIIRENVGYDFMSYKIGLSEYDLNNFDEVIICNDSVYGPLYSFKKVFGSMAKKDCDFWGITLTSCSLNKDPKLHLQSYFCVFKRRVFLSECFSYFWNNVEILNNKSDVIDKYEIGLTQSLLKCNFKVESLVKLNKLSAIKYYISKQFNLIRRSSRIIRLIFQEKNPSTWYWDYCIEKSEMPFLKTSLLKKNNKRYLSNLKRAKKMIQYSSYPFKLIDGHASRYNNHKL
jgi:lipopolysaccharide biosynthesis protein